jgi:hypothetical protein
MLLSDTYYVSTQGADSNPGTLESPWANLSFAITVASAGDTILMRGGTYFTHQVWIRWDRGMGGANGQYLTIKNFPGEVVSVGGERRMIVEAHYVRIEGLNFRLPYNVVGGGEGFQLINNVFEGSQPGHGAITFFANNGLIEGNKIAISGGGDSQDHGIYLFSGRNNVVRNNLISGMAGYGLHLYDEGDSLSFGNILIEGNVIRNSRLRSGIIIAPDFGLEAQDIIIRRNIITNNVANGIRLRNNTHHVEIYNNTIYGNGWSADNEDGSSAISVRDAMVHDVAIKDNIIEMSWAGAYHIQNREGSVNITAERNLYWGSSSSQLKGVIDSDQIYADPWLVDPAGNDFHLASLSPAIDAGMNTGMPFHGLAPDLGAMEFGILGVAIAPPSQDFGKVKINLTLSKTIEMISTGTENLEVAGAILKGANADEFSIENGNEPITLFPGTSQDLTVSFNPTIGGAKNAVLQIKFNGAAQDTALSISLIGFGDPGDVPDMAISAATHDYGEVEMGMTSSTTFEATNTGALDLEVTSISILGPDSLQFSVDDGVVPFVLAPGDSHNLTVNFSPTSVGRKSASLRLESNDWDDPLMDISLTGNAIAARLPDISVSSTSHDFGSAKVGLALSHIFQIMNTGTKDLECYSSLLLGSDSTEFLIAQNGAPYTLSPGATWNLVVSFRPTSLGIKSCVLRLTSNDPDEPNLNISLIGIGAPTTGISENPQGHPKEFALKQNYPNPFNPETLIEYDLPTASYVNIRIYDLKGREVRELANGLEPPGIHTVTWNGKNELGRAVASGIYFYKIEASGTSSHKRIFSKTRQMIVLR